MKVYQKNVTKIELLMDVVKPSCIYCNKMIKKRSDLTVDHVLPKSMGGSDNKENLVISCTKCNKDKKDLLLTQYIRAFDVKITPEIARFL